MKKSLDPDSFNGGFYIIFNKKVTPILYNLYTK